MSKIGRSSGWQLAAVVLVLTVVGVLLYGSNAIHGGFISDAWANRSTYVFASKSGFFGGVSAFMDLPNFAVRPLLAVYFAALNTVFGGHMGFWLGWLIVTGIAMCAVLYILLRRLSMGALDAAAVAVLVLVFPATGSLRLWAAMMASPITIILALVGFLIALSAFERKNLRAGLILHGVSLLFFVASLLLYEPALPVMMLSVLVYRLKVPWRPAIYRWIVDVVVLGTIALTVTHSSTAGYEQNQALEGGMLHHAHEIFGQLHTFLATVVLPFGNSSWYILLLLALIPATGALVYWLLPSGAEMRIDLKRWGIVMAGGAIIVLAGYAIYIPALAYYVPLRVGIADRMNAVPSIGWVLLFYGGARMLTLLLFQGVPNARRIAQVAAVVGCALVAVGWVKVVHAESNSYTAAFREDLRVLSVIQTALPKPPPEATIWTFGQPVLIAPEIPVFGNTWDMTTSVQMQYDDPTLKSYVAGPETKFICKAKEVEPSGFNYSEAEAPLLASPYGLTYFVNTVTGEYVRIDSQAACEKAAATWEPSPILPVA